MRRPLNWFVFGLSLAFLFANLTFGRRPAPPVVQAAIPLAVELNFPHLVIGDPTPPQFGYVRDDGSFLPLVQPPASLSAADAENLEDPI